MSKTKQKFIIASGVIFLTSAAIINSIYLPFYSDIGKQNAKMAESGQIIDRDSISKAGGGSRGSMWANIEKKRTQKDEIHPPKN